MVSMAELELKPRPQNPAAEPAVTLPPSCLQRWVCPGHSVIHAAVQPKPEVRFPVSGVVWTDSNQCSALEGMVCIFSVQQIFTVESLTSSANIY